MILLAIAIICAIAVFSAIVLRDLRIPAIGLVLLLLSSLIVGAGWPLIVEQFSVKPNAAQKEKDYIERSIRATRQAYGLTDDVVTYRDYSGNTAATAQQVAADRRRPRISGCWTRRSSARRSRSSSRARTSTPSPTSCRSTVT